MRDRIPVNPGRVLITPEDGSAAFYATMVRADNPTQEGTALNKATLLKDATAAKLGLGADAVPDDAFNVLSRFHSELGNEYVWEKYTSETVETYDIETSGVRQVNTDASNFYYSASFHITDGLFVLDNPSKISWVYPDDLSDLVGKYCISGGTNTSGDTMYLIDSSIHVSGTSIYCNAPTRYSNIHDEEVCELVGYVNSSDPNAYPIDDGFIYTALGQLGNKVQIATGSYTGTGTYGSSNPNSLTFDFAPKLLIFIDDSGHVMGNQSNSTYYDELLIGNPQTLGTDYVRSGFPSAYDDGTYSYSKRSADGKTLYWYINSKASYQYNTSGTVYRYVAIG